MGCLILYSNLLWGSFPKCLPERQGLDNISSYGIPKRWILIGPCPPCQPIGPDEELLVWYNGEDNPEIAAALEEERTSSLNKKSSPRAKRGSIKTMSYLAHIEHIVCISVYFISENICWSYLDVFAVVSSKSLVSHLANRLFQTKDINKDESCCTTGSWIVCCVVNRFVERKNRAGNITQFCSCWWTGHLVASQWGCVLK